LKKVSLTLYEVSIDQFHTDVLGANEDILSSNQKISQAELIFGFVMCHNLPVRIMKELPETLKRAFFDFEIAKGIQIDRTKTTYVINLIIGKVVFFQRGVI